MTDHVVAQGECLSSIADQYGFFWETLWEFADNAPLKELGRHPNTLLPGDVVRIPPLRPAFYTRATGARHTWRVKGVPVKIRVQILVDGVPRANTPFTLDAEGVQSVGQTDADGVVDTRVPTRARSGTLTVGEGDDAVVYELALGHIDPPDTVTGIQGRLSNLGFACEPTGALDDGTRQALAAFQSSAGLEVSGEPDGATIAKLQEKHDNP